MDQRCQLGGDPIQATAAIEREYFTIRLYIELPGWGSYSL